MKEVYINDRLEFLAKTFNIFDDIDNQIKELIKDGYTSIIIKDLLKPDIILGIISEKCNENGRILKKVNIHSSVFTDMLIADPSVNKIYLQWMLNLFVRFTKDDNINSAIRLVTEDLLLANDYLVLFDNNKRKQKFKDLAKTSYILKHISDPTNINQYHSLSQLFDAVDPFVEKKPSEIEKLLIRMVNAGKATIPVKDRKYTLYIPKTRDASVVFASYTNWCTARVGNSMFNTYTTDNRKPNRQKSDIYIIIDNDFFTGESQDLFQIHFETNQIKDRSNTNVVNFFTKVISKSESLSNFFQEELLEMAKQDNKNIEKNNYLKSLVKFGFAESLFDLLDIKTPLIKIMNTEIARLPDISKFTMVDQIVISDAKLVEIHPSIGSLIGLEMLCLPGNSIISIPNEIGMLKNLIFMNLNDSPIEHISNNITYLDRSNGGSLETLKIKEKDIGAENYKKLQRLLPTTEIS